jgi:tetratricopeptide (TPR) repeat protein
MQITANCLSPPAPPMAEMQKAMDKHKITGVEELVWTTWDPQFADSEKMIMQFMNEEGLTPETGIDHIRFQKLLVKMEKYPIHVKGFLIKSWALFEGMEKEESIPYTLNLLRDLLDNPSLTPYQYVDALNWYTGAIKDHRPAYPLAIEALKKAQKRKDLTRDQMFYIDTQLAYFEKEEDGVRCLERLIKKYPDKRQCIGICGEQFAIGCRNDEKAFETYKKVVELCPEMMDDPISLLNYSHHCCNMEKPKEVLEFLLRYIKAHPNDVDALEILRATASIYNHLDEHEMAAEMWNKIVDFDVPEALLSDSIKKLKETAKMNAQNAADRAASGWKRNNDFKLPEKVFWTPLLIALVVLDISFVLLLVFLYARHLKRSRSNNNDTQGSDDEK